MEACLEVELHLPDVSKKKNSPWNMLECSAFVHVMDARTRLMRRCDLTSNAASRSLSRIHKDDAGATFLTSF